MHQHLQWNLLTGALLFCCISGRAQDGLSGQTESAHSAGQGKKIAWKAVYTRPLTTDTLYAIREDRRLAYTHHPSFPEYDIYNNMPLLDGGYDLRALEKSLSDFPGTGEAPFLSPGEKLCFLKRVTSRTADMDSTVSFRQRLYVKNIHALSFYILDPEKKRVYRKKMVFQYDGFQAPETSQVNEWDTDSLLAASWAGPPTGDLLAIAYQPSGNVPSPELVIGDLTLSHLLDKEYDVDHPFFIDVLGPGYLNTLNRRMPLHSDFIRRFITDFDTGLVFPVIQIMPLNPADSPSTADRINLLHDLLLESLKKYPFYTEKGVNKDTVIHRMNRIFADSQGGTDPITLARSINTFLQKNLNDSHFFLDYRGSDDEDETLVKSPIRVTELNGAYFIAAVFDTLYGRNLLGSRLISIDGRPADAYADSVLRARCIETHPNRYQRNVILSTLLDRHRNETSEIAYENSRTGQEETVRIRYDRKYGIPSNFRSVDYEFKMINDNIAYYRVREWDDNAFIRFINHWDEISRSRALILDIRGNGGGSLYQSANFFSIFLDKPQRYFQAVDPDGSAHPFVLKPNSLYHYAPGPGRKVVVIGDYGTACASEGFLANMHKLKNTFFLSATPTFGTFAVKHDIELPFDDITLYVNCISDKMLLGKDDDESIEWRGIRPDKAITLQRVEDLKPYNDKLLQEAVRLAQTEINQRIISAE